MYIYLYSGVFLKYVWFLVLVVECFRLSYCSTFGQSFLGFLIVPGEIPLVMYLSVCGQIVVHPLPQWFGAGGRLEMWLVLSRLAVGVQVIWFCL